MIKSGRWIRRMAKGHGMIRPFEEKQLPAGGISVGISSEGLKARIRIL